jgi:hypothetical protein
MRRRELLLLLGGFMTAPCALQAEQKAVAVVGFLRGGSGGPYEAAFSEGLRETGYVEGQNLVIEYRRARGHYDRLPALAADLVGRKVDLIVTGGGTPPARGEKCYFHDPNRLHRRRSDRGWPSLKSRPAGRQHHRHSFHDSRDDAQANGVAVRVGSSG